MWGQGMPKNFADVVAELLPLYRTKAPKTFVEFESVTRRLLIPFFGDKPMNQVGALWRHYCAEQHTKTPDRKLIVDRKLCRIILGYAFDCDLIVKIPRLKLDPVDRVPRRLGRDVTEDEITRVCHFASRNVRDLVLLAFHTGMRFSECRKLRVEYLDFYAGVIRLPGNVVKTRTPRSYPLPEEIRPMLRMRCASRKNGFLFYREGNLDECLGASQRSFQRAIKRAGVSFSFHDLRRAFITRKLKSGMPLEVLSKLVGASQDVARDAYLKVKADDWAEAPKAVIRLAGAWVN